MTKKVSKLRIVIVCALLLAFLCSAGFAAGKMIRKATEDEICHKATGDDVEISALDAQKLLKQSVRSHARRLATQIYPEAELLNDIHPNTHFMNLWTDSYWKTQQILSYYPTQNIRHMEAEDGTGYYYGVWMTDKGARYYIFFAQDGTAYGAPVYMVEKASYADFADLQVGDSVTKVEAIDSAATCYKSYFEEIGNRTVEKANQAVDLRYTESGVYPLAGMHLLEDGILELRYRYAEDGDYIISEILYSEDFIAQNSLLEVLGEDADETVSTLRFYYEILEKDYIAQEIVLADVEPRETGSLPVEDRDWSLSCINGATGEQKLLTKAEIDSEEIQTVVTCRTINGKEDGEIATIFAGGVPVDNIALLTENENWKSLTFRTTEGVTGVIEKEKAEEQGWMLVWIQNKKYALDSCESGLALTYPENSPGEFITSIEEISFYE